MNFSTLSAYVRWFCLALFFVGLTGCATAPPVQEMSDARQAIAAAREAGADRLAVDQLGRAESSLQDARVFLVTGTSNAYWQAKKAAIDAKNMAFKALLTSRNATTP